MRTEVKKTFLIDLDQDELRTIWSLLEHENRTMGRPGSHAPDPSSEYQSRVKNMYKAFDVLVNW